jgi:hypothetical protein
MNTEIKEEQENEEELTFSELYSSVLLNGEVVITIPTAEVERVKTGLKNVKAKQAIKMKEDGLIPDPSVFTFLERVALDEHGNNIQDFCDLSIELSRRSVVKIKKLRIPDQTL